MKNKIIVIISLFVILIGVFINFSYGRGYVRTLQGFLYDNTDSVYSKGERNKGLFHNNTYFSFMKAFDDMMKYVDSVNFKVLADNSSEDELKVARYSIEDVENEWISHYDPDIDEDVANKEFKEITGYEINKKTEYFKNMKTNQYKKLQAAYDYKRKFKKANAVSINDTYEEQMKYTKEQINSYNDKYGEQFNLTASQEKEVRTAWESTLEKKYSNNEAKTSQSDELLAKEDKKISVNPETKLYKIPERAPDKNETTNLDEIIEAADTFVNSATENKIEANMIQNLSNTIYNILLVAGIIIAIIIGAVIGIMFITGSVEQKADVKKLLIPYIVGCVVIFGSFAIWKIAVIMFSTL